MTAEPDVCLQNSLRPFLQVHPSWAHAPITPQTRPEGLAGEHQAPLYEPGCGSPPLNRKKPRHLAAQTDVPENKTPDSKPARKWMPADSLKDSVRDMHWLLVQQSVSAFDAGLEPVYFCSSKLFRSSWHVPQQLTSLAGFSAKERGPTHLSELASPQILTGFQSDWLACKPSMLQHWQAASLEPVSQPVPVLYFVICPKVVEPSTRLALQTLSQIYRGCRLGEHLPAAGLVSSFSTYGPESRQAADSAAWITDLQQAFNKLRCKLMSGAYETRPCGAGLDSHGGPALVIYLVPPASDADTIAAALMEGARCLKHGSHSQEITALVQPAAAPSQLGEDALASSPSHPLASKQSREEKSGVQEWCSRYEGAANLAYIPEACPNTSSNSIDGGSSTIRTTMPWFTIQVLTPAVLADISCSMLHGLAFTVFSKILRIPNKQAQEQSVKAAKIRSTLIACSEPLLVLYQPPPEPVEGPTPIAPISTAGAEAAGAFHCCFAYLPQLDVPSDSPASSCSCAAASHPTAAVLAWTDSTGRHVGASIAIPTDLESVQQWLALPAASGPSTPSPDSATEPQRQASQVDTVSMDVEGGTSEAPADQRHHEGLPSSEPDKLLLCSCFSILMKSLQAWTAAGNPGSRLVISHLGKLNDAKIRAWNASLAHLCNAWRSKSEWTAGLALPAALSVISVQPLPTATALISPAESVDSKAWLHLATTDGPGSGMEATILTQQTCMQGLGQETIRPVLQVRAVAHRQAPKRKAEDAQPSAGAKRKLSKLSRVSMPLPEGEHLEPPPPSVSVTPRQASQSQPADSLLRVRLPSRSRSGSPGYSPCCSTPPPPPPLSPGNNVAAAAEWPPAFRAGSAERAQAGATSNTRAGEMPASPWLTSLPMPSRTPQQELLAARMTQISRELHGLAAVNSSLVKLANGQQNGLPGGRYLCRGSMSGAYMPLHCAIVQRMLALASRIA